MKVRSPACVSMTLAAWTVCAVSLPQRTNAFVPPRLMRPHRMGTATTMAAVLSPDENPDCGCDTIYSGKPSDRARSLDARRAIASATIFSVNGDPTSINELIGTRGSAVVVFLRSLG